jgi:hypothetical protein
MSNVIQFPRNQIVPQPLPIYEKPDNTDPSEIEEAQLLLVDDLIRLAELNHELQNLLKKIQNRTK